MAAICLGVGRPQDFDRVICFVEVAVLDAEVFESIHTALRTHREVAVVSSILPRTITGIMRQLNARKLERRAQLAALPASEKQKLLEEIVAAAKAIGATMPPMPADAVRRSVWFRVVGEQCGGLGQEGAGAFPSKLRRS